MSVSRKSQIILIVAGLLIAAAWAMGLYRWPGPEYVYSQNSGSEAVNSVHPAAAQTGPVYYTNRVAILTYHNFDENETGTTISPQHFREHLETLKMKGYNFISLGELGDFLAGKPGLPPNAVAITFDDGYESVYRYAFPVLQEKGLPAAVFVIVKNVGATENQIPKCTWAEMQEMQTSGLQFYSHSYDSHHLVAKKDGTLGPALTTNRYLPAARREENRVEYEDRVMQDLLISKIILENALHSEVNFLALPYGAQTSFVQQNARLAGYKYIFTVEPGLVDAGADPLALKRLNAGQAGMDGNTLHKLILSYTR